MELFFLVLLIVTMAGALAMGFPVAFALPGSAILTIGLASFAGYVFTGSVDSYFYQDGPIQWLTAGVTNFRGVYWEVERDTLIAIPLFVFMGIMLQRSKIAEDLLVTMAQLFGPIPGGLGISVVVVGALLAATTGIVGATVVAMGLISLPAMLRSNYSQALATGTISASGTLGQIIPPSIVLIILADQLSNATDQASTARKAAYKAATGEFSMPTELDVGSTSAGEMFLGALIPGIILVALYIVYILVIAILRPQSAPAVRYDGKFDLRFAGRVLMVLVPPLALILAVLGSIITGIATVNQAGAIGAVGAMIMAGYRLAEGRRHTYTPALLAIASIVAIFVLLGFYDLNIKNVRTSGDSLGIALATIAVVGLLVAVVWSGWRAFRIDDTLRGVMVETAKTTSLVFIILLGAAMLTAAFRGFGGEELVRGFLTGLPGGFWGQFVVVMAVIFLLGFFLDFIEIAVVVVPIVSPILLADPTANITAVWLGVMIGINIQTSFLTPPFGFALFYLRGVAPPSVRTIEMYRGVVAFISLQLLALVIVGAFPPLVNYVPTRSYLTSETAPPPANPRLQACLEEYMFAWYDRHEAELHDTIEQARALDISYLPDDRRNALAGSFGDALATFGLVDDVRKADAAVAAYLPQYTPLHRAVRDLQREIADDEAKIADLKQTRSRLMRARDEHVEEIAELDRQIADFDAQIGQLRAAVPAAWQDARKRYVDLARAERTARLAYRRNVDGAYSEVRDLLAVIADTDRMVALRDRMNGLVEQVRGSAPEQAVELIKAAESDLSPVPDTSSIQSLLTGARRDLARSQPRVDAALEALGKAVAQYESELAWRTRAAAGLLSPLGRYEEAIRNSIGAREQPRLTVEQGKALAACLSHHRDISLSF
jgi:tripartite ATP-independent transporter DctM subunit